MRQESQELDLVWASIALVTLAGIGLVWWSSGAMGLDMATGAAVLWRLLVVAITTGSLVYFGQSMALFHPSHTWPLLLAAGWSCCWPALDYYAALAETVDAPARLWWDAWHTKIGGAVVIAGVGTGIKFRWGRRRALSHAR